MTRSEIIKAMAKANNLSERRAKRYFDMVVDAIMESLVTSGKVDIYKRFKMEVTETKPRIVKSNLPSIGETFVPPKKKVKLTFYEEVRDLIDSMRLV